MLVADGADDVIVCVQPACGNLEREGEAYPAAVSFESGEPVFVPGAVLRAHLLCVAIVVDSGHDLNLHLGSPRFSDLLL